MNRRKKKMNVYGKGKASERKQKGKKGKRRVKRDEK